MQDLAESQAARAEDQAAETLGGRIQRWLRETGAGLISGAADDDPSGIGTYAQSGVQFGYGQLWTALFMLPLMTAVQEACARIGIVKGKGLAAVIRDNYSRPVLYAVVLLTLVANTINIGADIGAMGAAANLVVPVDPLLLMLVFVVLMVGCQVFIPYRRYAKTLKWLALSLLAYPLTVVVVSVPWDEVLRATFVPHVELSFAFLFVITGVLGTTISPYMFFWQASEEVEDAIAANRLVPDGVPRISRAVLRDVRLDTFVGMLFSEITTWSIIVVAATVLHNGGVTDIHNAADAARALLPLVHTFPNAGLLAEIIFATGIIGLGLLSVPILAGSAAYALAEAFGWHEGLYLKLKEAPAFYAVIIAATVIGFLMNLGGIDPMKALVYAAVINGVVAVPLLFLIACIARSEQIMGQYKSGRLSDLTLWVTFLGMGAAAIATLATLGKQ
jgi:Mn2+/Fe2+ NRAMP family transporter